MEEITNMLVEQFSDEIEDSNMYYDLAVKASDHCNDRHLAHCLYEISKDEYTHAKFIHDYMVSNGMCIPEESKCHWDTLVQKARKIYPDVPMHMYDV